MTTHRFATAIEKQTSRDLDKIANEYGLESEILPPNILARLEKIRASTTLAEATEHQRRALAAYHISLAAQGLLPVNSQDPEIAIRALETQLKQRQSLAAMLDKKSSAADTEEERSRLDDNADSQLVRAEAIKDQIEALREKQAGALKESKPKFIVEREWTIGGSK